MAQVKRCVRYYNKYKKFGASISIDEEKSEDEEIFTVSINIPPIHIDKFGNMAIKKGCGNAI